MDSQKSAAFYNLIKSLGYSNIRHYSPKSFDFFFEIAETREFFDWFLANVNSDCCLSASEISSYQEKFKKCQIILNIDKLKALYEINAHGVFAASTEFQSTECYKQTLEQKEAEISLLQQRLKFRKVQKQCLIEELNEVKAKKKFQLEKSQHDLNLKQIYLKNVFKSLNTQFKKLIKTLNGELKTTTTNGTHRFHEVARDEVDKLITNEDNYLSLVRNLLNVSKVFNESDVANEDFKTQVLLFEHFYPKLILHWFNVKCEKVMHESQLKELVKFNAAVKSYLAHKNQSNPFAGHIDEAAFRDFDNLSEKTKYASLNLKILLENCSKIGTKIAFGLKQLTGLKIVNLLNYEAESKQLSYNFLILKQEGLLHSLLTQHARISLLVDLERTKLNDLDLIKQMFELIRSKASTAVAPSLSNTSMQMCNSLTNFSLNYDFTLNNSLVNSASRVPQTTVKVKQQSNEKFYRILNQLLIIYLTKLNSRFSNFKISIQLNDNLSIMIDYYKKCLLEAKKAKITTKNDLTKLYKSVNSAILYLYGSTNDLSKININLKLINSNEIKQLHDNVDQIENLFYANIFQVYNSKKSMLKSDKLQQIKRHFFIEFYLNPKNVAAIIEGLNNM